MSCAVDEGRYNAPMPWIGVYVAAASMACAMALLFDCIWGICQRKVWLPCKLFSLNATSLTLLAIATKLPVDISTSMPGALDQFSKLSGTALLCTAMANFLPSLGAMEDSQVILNVVPLAILVITVIANICIQIGTGVIYAFLPQHIITLSFMLFMLLITCSSALTVPTMKQLLKQQYELKHEQLSRQGSDDESVVSMVTKLEKEVKKYWMIASTCNPEYVISRSCLGVASDFFCVLQTCVLIEALVRAVNPDAVTHCAHDFSSNYKWSILFICVAQAFAVVVGVLGPLHRTSLYFKGVFVGSFLIQISGTDECNGTFKVDRYWIQSFGEWKDSPLPSNIQSKRCRRLIRGTKNLFLRVIRWLHIAVVLFSKLVVQLRSILFSNLFEMAIEETVVYKANAIILAEVLATEIELRDYVVHLEGEDKLVDGIFMACYVKAEEWIRGGRQKSLTQLTNLLRVSTVSQGFKRGQGSGSSAAGSASEEPPNCWTLPLVTLTSIASAIPCTEQVRIGSLLNGVREGIKYARLVDKKLDSEGMANIREAAEIVWQGIDLYHRLLDVDLAALDCDGKNPKKVIERIAEIGKNYIVEFQKSKVAVWGNKKNGLDGPPRVLACISICQICESILREYSNFSADELFEWLHVLISDMLGACLTHLPRALYLEFCNSSIKAKDDSVREAAWLLGEAKNILQALGTDGNQDLVVNQCKYFDHWRSFMLNLSTLSPISMSNASDDELCILLE